MEKVAAGLARSAHDRPPACAADCGGQISWVVGTVPFRAPYKVSTGAAAASEAWAAAAFLDADSNSSALLACYSMNNGLTSNE